MLSFAADFTHSGETSPSRYTIAEIRYNATVPEPVAAGLAVPALLLLRRKRE